LSFANAGDWRRTSSSLTLSVTLSQIITDCRLADQIFDDYLTIEIVYSGSTRPKSVLGITDIRI